MHILYGLAARIPGFHPGGPGSTPGMGNVAFCIFVILNGFPFRSNVGKYNVNIQKLTVHQ